MKSDIKQFYVIADAEDGGAYITEQLLESDIVLAICKTLFEAECALANEYQRRGE
jgi:phage FluMu gp28-like protein